MLARNLEHGLDTRLRIHAASVGDDRDLLFHDLGQQPVEHAHEVGRVAGFRPPRALLLHDAHRDLGQVVQGQVVDRAFP